MGAGAVRGSGHDLGSLSRMSYEIRTFGDPVLVTRAAEVTDINGKIVRMIDEMFDTLYDSDSGIGLAAPQVGIQRQIFVWDMEDDPQVIINPKIVEAEGEWVYDEGCLSIPGLFVEMTRPKTVLMRGLDLDGNEIEFEADELEARLFQHELDHLNGVLMFDRMQPDQRSRAMAEYQKIKEQGFAIGSPVRLEAELFSTKCRRVRRGGDNCSVSDDCSSTDNTSSAYCVSRDSRHCGGCAHESDRARVRHRHRHHTNG